MFKQAERLSRPQFTEFFRTGARQHGKYLSLIYTPYPTRHVAVVVGKKVSKKAHERNRLRRRVYGQLYRLLKKETKNGVYILVVKPPFLTLTKQDQLTEVQNLVNRVTMSA